MKTHCKHGHAYDEENTYWYVKRGRMQRGCRECKRLRNENWRRNQGIQPWTLERSVETFWAKTVRGKKDECWEWLAARNKWGYGVVGVYGQGMMVAHRFAYELVKGKIPKGYQVHHTCENPTCVNPNHLVVILASKHKKLHERKGVKV